MQEIDALTGLPPQLISADNSCLGHKTDCSQWLHPSHVPSGTFSDSCKGLHLWTHMYEVVRVSEGI